MSLSTGFLVAFVRAMNNVLGKGALQAMVLWKRDSVEMEMEKVVKTSNDVYALRVRQQIS